MAVPPSPKQRHATQYKIIGRYIDALIGEGLEGVVSPQGNKITARQGASTLGQEERDEHRNVRRGQNELETQLFRSQFGDFQLRLCRIVDQFDGDILEKVPQSFGGGLHEGIMTA